MIYDGMPDTEQYKAPSTEAEALDEELKYAIDREDLRSRVGGLVRQYQNSVLSHGLMKYAILSWSSRINSGDVEPSEEHVEDSDFFAGEIMAAHCNVSTSDGATRKRMLNSELLETVSYEYLASADDEDPRLSSFMLGATEMRDNWDIVFSNLPDDIQGRLAKMIDALFGVDEVGQQTSFILGYSLAHTILGRISDQVSSE